MTPAEGPRVGFRVHAGPAQPLVTKVADGQDGQWNRVRGRHVGRESEGAATTGPDLDWREVSDREVADFDRAIVKRGLRDATRATGRVPVLDEHLLVPMVDCEVAGKSLDHVLEFAGTGAMAAARWSRPGLPRSPNPGSFPERLHAGLPDDSGPDVQRGGRARSRKTRPSASADPSEAPTKLQT